jgi:hypothetical protein
MVFRKLSLSRNRIPLALLLAVALVFAQWQGLAHRIAHTQWSQAQTYHTGSTGGEKDSSFHHSCDAFDAATVGDSIHPAPFVTPVLTSTRVLALWLAFISWDAPCSPYFSSRAPPQT